MNKYLEFKEISFKGKTKRFEILSKTSYDRCSECDCEGLKGLQKNGSYNAHCKKCNGTGEIPIILGRISWYPQWRQYTFSPSYPTTWNRDCLNDIIFFITNLMKDRKIIIMKKDSLNGKK